MKKNFKKLVTAAAVTFCLSGVFFTYNAMATETGGIIAATDELTKEAYQLSITQLPAKTAYTCGESLDLAGLVVQSYNTDGTISIVTDYTVVSFDNSKAGVQAVVLQYQNCTISFNITIKPAKVQNISVREPGTSSYLLTWEANSDISYYEIYSRNETTGMYGPVGSSTTNSFTVYATSASLCTYQIRAVKNDNGTLYIGDFSDDYTAATSPEKVQSLTVSSSMENAADLSWSAVTGASGYSIYRRAETAKEFSLCANTNGTAYQDTGLKPGVVYEYKVSAYIYDDDFYGEASPLVTICTNPGQVKLRIKTGEEKVRLTWMKVTGATSYDVYESDGMGGYGLIHTNIGNSNCTYLVEGLTTGDTYSFYVIAHRDYNGVIYSSAQPAPLEVTITEVAPTSVEAKYFAGKTEFLNSAAYTLIDSFKTNVNYNKSYIIPGLVTTNVGGFVSNTMCPQGICFAKDYLLTTAYDLSGEEASVIYVMNKNSKKLLTTLVLPTKAHVGGICYDGTYLWLTTGSKASAIEMADVVAAAKSGEAHVKVDFYAVCKVGIAASYITYYDEKLWVGSYNELQSTYMYGFEIADFGDSLDLERVNSLKMPTRVQGVSFTEDGYLILSRSCQLYQGLRGYMRRIDVYQPEVTDEDKGTISLGSCINYLYTPSMNEGITLRGSYLYVIFESGAFNNASYKMDRICAIKLNSVLGEDVILARAEKNKLNQ